MKSWVIGVFALLMLVPQGAANASPAPAALSALAPNTGSGHFDSAVLSNFGDPLPPDDFGVVAWKAEGAGGLPASQEFLVARQYNPQGIFGVSVVGVLKYDDATPDEQLADITCEATVKLGSTTLVAGQRFDTWINGPSDGSKRVLFGERGSSQVDLRATVPQGLPVGINTLRARYDCGDAGVATLQTTVQVFENDPDSDFYSLSIEDGQFATNSTNVQVTVKWPWDQIIDKVMLSNDGGFGSSRTKTFDATTRPISWEIDSLGDERTQRVVYVRYHSPLSGWLRAGQVSDDIYLDTVVPVISSAVVTGSRSLHAASSRVTLSVTASDNRSGVSMLQAAASKDSRQRVTTKFAKRMQVVPPKGGIRFIRVQDGAGNWSRWKSVT